MEKINLSKINLKKKDWVLIIVIICAALGIIFLHHVMKDTGTGCVTVKVNGIIEGTYDLNDEQEVSINGGSNILLIKNGKAVMAEADCPDLLCVKQKAIFQSHENIICLPNKVIVEVDSKRESKMDAVAN